MERRGWETDPKEPFLVYAGLLPRRRPAQPPAPATVERN
jgi:hypothetical protein